MVNEESKPRSVTKKNGKRKILSMFLKILKFCSNFSSMFTRKKKVKTTPP